MLAQPDLRDPVSWGSHLGLLTVPLFPSPRETTRFVLLNGARGSFCLDVARGDRAEDVRSLAWSSNVGHYVSVCDDQILVQRWDSRAASESYTYASVSSTLQRFHEYLEANSPKPELSIISLGVDVFRQLRKAARALDGTAALKAYLCLLACTLDGTDRARLDLGRWQLDPSARAAASEVTAADWAALRSNLADGRPQDGLVPRLDLLLRHASGQLFQEAHYEAVCSPGGQLPLDGFLPGTARFRRAAGPVGVYYTPPALVRSVVEECLASLGRPGDSVAVFDPACGSGEFLREAVRQLRTRGYTGHIDAIGWDASDSACQMARFALAWDVTDHPQVDVHIHCKDSLAHADEWPAGVDLLLMNPPFQSWVDMDPEHRAAVRAVLAELTGQRADLSHAFLLKAATCVRDGGVVGAVMPASLLDGISARRLRGRLGEELAPRLIARLGSHLLFPGAVVDAALYVAKRERTEQPTIAVWSDHRSASSAAALRALRKSHAPAPRTLLPVQGPGFSIYPHEQLGQSEASWAPRPYSSWQLFRAVAHLPRARQLFNIHQGALTGHNKAFLLPKPTWLQLPAAERRFFRPAVVNRSIRQGFLTDDTYVFYPYGDADIRDEAALAGSLPQFYQQHLLLLKGELLRRSRIDAARWWQLSLPRPWQFERQPKLVSTYFGDAGSFAFDDGGDFVVVHGYCWQPKAKFMRSPSWLAAARAYLAVLSSPTFSRLLPFVSDHVRGGQWNLSRRYVAEIPMPNMFDQRAAPGETAELCRLGARLLRGDVVPPEELDELVAAVYGLERLV